ncbi:protein of unknown function [Thermococcus nautili]|nr:protein of unknown function [Thermococcus nautili]
MDNKNHYPSWSRKKKPNLSKFFDILDVEIRSEDIEKKLIIEFCELPYVLNLAHLSTSKFLY